MDRTGYTYLLTEDSVFITKQDSWAYKEYLERNRLDAILAQADVEAAYERGKQLFEAGDYSSAKEVFKQLLEENRWNPYLEKRGDELLMVKERVRKEER